MPVSVDIVSGHSGKACRSMPLLISCFIQVLHPRECIAASDWENYRGVPEKNRLSSTIIRSPIEVDIYCLNDGGAEFDSRHFPDGTFKDQ